jgi:spore coat protein H
MNPRAVLNQLLGLTVVSFGLLMALDCVVGEDLTNKQRQRMELSRQFFASDRVLKIDIEILAEGIESLKKYKFDFRKPWKGPRPEAKAIVRVAGKVFNDVAIHLKGAVGSFRGIDGKPGMTLNLDKHVPGQELFGLDKFYLNNSVQDPTYLNEKLGRELYNEAGVPTPRASHAIVELNGRQLGVYVLIEGFDKRFLRKHFEDVTGNLYDGGFANDIDAELNINSGDQREDQTDLKRLNEAVNSGEREQIEGVLDLDRFYSLVALDVILWNWDGYSMSRNNYRLYSDRAAAKFVFIPHGLDQLFSNPEGVIYPMMVSRAANAVMNMPNGEEEYLERVESLVEGVFVSSRVNQRAKEMAAILGGVLEEINSSEAAGYEQRITKLTKRIQKRERVLRKIISGRDQLIAFDAAGMASEFEWESVNEFAEMTANQETVDQRTSLTLRVDQGASWSRWTTELWLERGNYRFECDLKYTLVEADWGDGMRGGVGIRVSGVEVTTDNVSRKRGESGWHRVEQEFALDIPIGAVSLSCELRARTGTVWFDRESLRLVRVDEE